MTFQHLVDHLRVKRGGRLVEEHHLRLHGQGAGDGHALLLATGELGGILLGLDGDAHAVEQPVSGLVGLRLGGLADLQRSQGDVVPDGHVAEQVEGLEDHADFRAQPGEVLTLLRQEFTVDVDLSAVDGLQTVDRAAQRGLTGTGGAENNDDLAGRNIEVDVLQGLEVPEVLVHRLSPLAWCQFPRQVHRLLAL